MSVEAIIIIIVLLVLGFIGSKLEEKKKAKEENKNQEIDIQLNSSDYESLGWAPTKKVFHAHPSLNTPLETLELHGLVVKINDRHYDTITANRQYGYWENLYKDDVLADITQNRLRQNDLTIKMLTEIRTVYELSELPPDECWLQIKKICNNPIYSAISDSFYRDLADFFYPSVFSFALGIKQPQIETLLKFNIKTISDLRNKEDSELLALPGIGKKTLSSLRVLQTENIPDFYQRIHKDRERWFNTQYALNHK